MKESCFFLKPLLFSPNEHSENVMGYTIRVNKHHFTEWYQFDHINANLTSMWYEVLSYMTTLVQMTSIMRTIMWHCR